MYLASGAVEPELVQRPPIGVDGDGEREPVRLHVASYLVRRDRARLRFRRVHPDDDEPLGCEFRAELVQGRSGRSTVRAIGIHEEADQDDLPAQVVERQRTPLDPTARRTSRANRERVFEDRGGEPPGSLPRLEQASRRASAVTLRCARSVERLHVHGAVLRYSHTSYEAVAGGDRSSAHPVLTKCAPLDRRRVEDEIPGLGGNVRTPWRACRSPTGSGTSLQEVPVESRGLHPGRKPVDPQPVARSHLPRGIAGPTAMRSPVDRASGKRLEIHDLGFAHGSSVHRGRTAEARRGAAHFFHSEGSSESWPARKRDSCGQSS